MASDKKKKMFSDDATGIDSEDSLDVNMIEFPDLQPQANKVPIGGNLFNSIPVKVTAELGSTMISLKDVYELAEGAIIELDRHAGEPLDLLVNGQLIAQGEVVAVDNNYGIRIKTIVKNNK